MTQHSQGDSTYLQNIVGWWSLSEDIAYSGNT